MDRVAGNKIGAPNITKRAGNPCQDPPKRVAIMFWSASLAGSKKMEKVPWGDFKKSPPKGPGTPKRNKRRCSEPSNGHTFH